MKTRAAIRAGLALLAMGGGSTYALFARADDTSDCIAASEAAQAARGKRSLIEASAEFAACARDVCPGPIKADCLQQHTEVEAAIPSVVFRPKDARADQSIDVKVSCDGAPFATELDGKAIPVDPGQHTFRFELATGESTERKIVIGEGEKARLIVIDLPGAAPPAPPPARPLLAPSRPAARGGVSIPGLVAGGIGVAALIPMATLWAVGTSDVHSMRNTCAPSAGGAGCASSRVDSDRTKLVVGDAFLGVAAAGIATGAVLLILRVGAHAPEASTAAARLRDFRLDVAPTRGGAWLSAATSF